MICFEALVFSLILHSTKTGTTLSLVNTVVLNVPYFKIKPFGVLTNAFVLLLPTKNFFISKDIESAIDKWRSNFLSSFALL